MMILVKIFVCIIKFINESYDFELPEKEFTQIYRLLNEAELLDLSMLGILRKFVID